MKNIMDDISGVIVSTSNPYEKHHFPFNMNEMRKYLKASGKSLSDLTRDDYERFRLPALAKAT